MPEKFFPWLKESEKNHVFASVTSPILSWEERNCSFQLGLGLLNFVFGFFSLSIFQKKDPNTRLNPPGWFFRL
jgi:hypothetical protein